MTKEAEAANSDVWKLLINDFDPVGPASPDEIAELFVDRKEGEPSKSVVTRLATSLRNSVGQKSLYKGLLTGHIGSGKSSELMRLAQELAPDFFVVWFDAESSLSREKANHFDVLLAMGVSIHAAAAAANLGPDRQLAEDFVKSFATFVRKYEDKKGFSLKLDQIIGQVFTIALTVVAGAVGGPVAAFMAGAAASGAKEVFKATTVELNVKDDLVRTLELPANRQEIIGRLNELIVNVQVLAGRPLLVITDGLDKVTALRARLLFAESSLLAEPAAALIYAAPIEFYHRLSSGVISSSFTEYSFLSNPAVFKYPAGDWRTPREANPPGQQVIRKIIDRRISRRGFKLSSLISEEALELIVAACGGVIRDAIRFMRDASISAQIEKSPTITKKIAEEVIDTQKVEMSVRLSASYRDALVTVMSKSALQGGSSEGVEDELLHAAYLLSYQGDRGRSWFDAHPNALYALTN